MRAPRIRPKVVATTKVELTHPPKRVHRAESGTIYVYGPTSDMITVLHNVGFARKCHKVAIFLNQQPVKLKAISGRGQKGTVVVEFEAVSAPEILASCFDANGMFVANPEVSFACKEKHHSKCSGWVRRSHYDHLPDEAELASYRCPCDCHGIVDRLAELAPKEEG